MRSSKHRIAPTRRDVLAGVGGVLAAASLDLNAETDLASELKPAGARPSFASRGPAEPFGYCLNTSTISGSNLTIAQIIGIASKAGYDAVEPWMHEIEDHEKKGGTLSDLRKQFSDAGLAVADAICFNEWIVDDQAHRPKGMEAMKRDMGKIAEIGGRHVAAPPVGAHEASASPINLASAAERYAALLELGRAMGVIPIVELWGFSRNLSQLGEVAYVAIQSRQPDAAMLLDIYHLHKGGSEFSSLRQINGVSLPLLHVNDYPATPPRETITDAQRSLSRRRHCAARLDIPNIARHWFQWLPFPGAVQPRLLEAEPRDGRPNRPGKNARCRPKCPGGMMRSNLERDCSARRLSTRPTPPPGSSSPRPASGGHAMPRARRNRWPGIR